MCKCEVMRLMVTGAVVGEDPGELWGPRQKSEFCSESS